MRPRSWPKSPWTISATQRFSLSAVETFTVDEMPAAGNRTVTNNQFNSTVRLNAGSAPAATKAWSGKLAGNQTLDLTALARTVGETVDATGLKLQMLLLNNLSESASLMIAEGASNGYAINGASGVYIVPPGAKLQTYYADSLADVAAGVKTLDITITAGEQFEVQLVFG